MSIYEYLDYKEFLRECLRSQGRKRGFQTAIAKAAGVQASFLSHVLNTHVHFTPEHALAAAQFLGLKPDEREYFVELVHLARAGTRELRDHVRAKVDRLRRAARAKSVQPSPPVLTGDAAKALYYSSWHYTAVHFGLTVKGLHTGRALSERLHIPLAIVMRTLGELEQMGLIRRAPDASGAESEHRWEVLVSDMTAEYGSPYGSSHALHWTHRAAQDISLRKTKGAFHFAAVFGASGEDYEKLKAAASEFLTKARAISEGSVVKDRLLALGCHLYEV